jgi:hypothetical protein
LIGSGASAVTGGGAAGDPEFRPRKASPPPQLDEFRKSGQGSPARLATDAHFWSSLADTEDP